MPLHDPMPPERVPPVGGDALPDPGDRAPHAPLSPAEIAGLQQSLARQQRRRHMYHAGPLQVWWDGQARWQVAPRGGTCQPFRVPIHAVSLEIVGDDAEGALLLAVVPLPAPEELEEGGAQHLGVTLEGGQTIAIDIALGERSGGTGRVYVVQLAYAVSAAVAAILPRPRPETPT